MPCANSQNNKFFCFFFFVQIAPKFRRVTMADRGKTETNRLKQNVEDQLNRLLQQLEDLKTEKDNMEESEYNEMWNDTMQQLKEFQASLKKMMAGDMTLVDSLSNVQLVR